MSDEIKTLWTVMVYIAADNDLVGDAWNTVFQLTQTVNNPVFEEQVRLVFQLDESDPLRPTRRYFRRGNIFARETVGAGETNTGDPQTLVDFIEWAHRNNPAQNYLLVLWGHANGVDDEDTLIDLKPLITPAPQPAVVAAVMPPPATLSATASSDNGNGAGATEGGAALDATGKAASALVDVTTGDPARTRDALTTFELKSALEAATTILGRKVSVLGMDACLLSLIEVCYQVSEQAEFYVGSEEVIPNTSWPYDRILRKLAERPSMQPPELAETIVDEYFAAYDEKTGAERKQVTLSYCDLSQSKEMGRRISTLSALLKRKLSDPKFRAVVVEARRKTQTFFITDYVDLHHFCQLVRDATDDGEIKLACQDVSDGIKTRFVKKSVHTKLEAPGAVDALENANGVSVYFPRISHTYASLDFSQQTHWDSFLSGYMNAVFQPAGEAADGGEVAEGYSADAQPPLQSSANAISSSPATAIAGVGSQHLNTGGKITMDDYQKDSTATAGGTGGAEAGAAKAYEANAAAPPVPATKKARIVLPINASITNAQGDVIDKLTAEAFLLFEGQNVVVEVPDGTPLTSTATPDNKASRGTETKATIGTRIVPALGAEIRLPACTLWKSFSDGSLTDLPAGTVVKTLVGGSQLVILEEVAVKGF